MFLAIAVVATLVKAVARTANRGLDVLAEEALVGALPPDAVLCVSQGKILGFAEDRSAGAAALLLFVSTGLPAGYLTPAPAGVDPQAVIEAFQARGRLVSA